MHRIHLFRFLVNGFSAKNPSIFAKSAICANPTDCRITCRAVCPLVALSGFRRRHSPIFQKKRGAGVDIFLKTRYHICICRCGGIGRHKGLKIPRQQCRTGSSPVSGTTDRVFITLPRYEHSFFMLFMPVSGGAGAFAYWLFSKIKRAVSGHTFRVQ